MFRLHKTRPAKSGERVDFKLSQFKAAQVPKGWERLFVSIVSVETGKTISKTGRAVVRNGTCQWTETLSESIWVSQDESSKEMDDCLFKLVVATGSARSGILGEATVNMTGYMSSSVTVPVTLPLTKCNHGTILQVKVQCLTPRTKLSDDELRETNTDTKDESVYFQDMDIISNGPESIARNTESSSSKNSDSLHQREPGSREASFSSLASYQSYDSAESSLGRENCSATKYLSVDDQQNMIRSEDSTSSQNSLPKGTDEVDDPTQSNDSSLNSQITGLESNSSDNQRNFSTSSLRVTGSSKNLLEAAEETIDKLRAETKMWERNAEKLSLDLDILRKEHADQSKNKENLDVELSAASAERDGLRQEVHQLKLLLEKSMPKQAALGNSRFPDEVSAQTRELENEVKFQKESNANLAFQLKRSQEANIELVSLLQELEETIEKQNVEIENLSALQSKSNETENSIKLNVEESRNLMIQLEQSQESEKNLQAKVRLLEEALQREGSDIEKEGRLKNQTFLVLETEYESKLAAKETEIVSLRTKLSESLHKRYSAEVELKDENDNNIQIQKLESLNVGMEMKIRELDEELTQKRFQVQRLEGSLLSKEEENRELWRCQNELEDKVSNLQREKSQLERNLEVFQRESVIATKCLDDMRNDLMVLSSGMDSHVSANKILERKSSELEGVKCELEVHLSDLEQKNEQMALSISGLEAQMRDLKDERDSIQVKLENSESLAISLDDEIARYRNEMESQKINMEQQLQDMHNQLMETQDGSECLRRENAKVQATVESLIDECSSLQKLNGELRIEKLELRGHCADLEAKLRESNKSLADCSKRLEVLEENLSLVMEDFASKEKRLTMEVDAIQDENRKLEEKLKLEESSWNQMYLEKKNEVENLQLELESLNKHLSIMQHERDKLAYDAAHEISVLRADKVKLETAIQETESKTNWIENEFKNRQGETEAKLEDLIGELSASRESQEQLMADHENVLMLLDTYKSSEEKLKTIVNGLELKLTVSEYEQQQHADRTNKMKVQKLKLEHLQDEVLALRDELNATRSDKEKLEGSLHKMSKECEDLKAERISFLEQISTLQKSASELEDYKCDKADLEEKLRHKADDLVAIEPSSMQHAELINELGQIKKTNGQCQQSIRQFEDERDALLRRTQTLEEQLILIKEEKRNQLQSNGTKSYGHHRQRGDDNRTNINNGSIHADGVDSVSKIQLLENELAKAMEANNMYKARLNRLSTEGRNSQSNVPRKSRIEGEVVSKDRYERTKSTLETELKDIRERYLHMSLKYAEVECQREELVMKLKGAKNGKRWFSQASS